MSNVTKNKLSGIAPITIDTEVTASGEYPVEGKGIKAYVDANKGMTNPMTTKGDLIVGGYQGNPVRLAKPQHSGELLGWAGPDMAWVSRDYYMTAIKAANAQCGIALWCKAGGENSFRVFLANRYFTSVDNPYGAVYGSIGGKAIVGLYVDPYSLDNYAIDSDGDTTKVTFGIDFGF